MDSATIYAQVLQIAYVKDRTSKCAFNS